jgi:2-keto-3-deoxy-L-rhamnonate aldolase RhmA
VKNALKRKLKSGKVSIGTWISIGHPDVAEILAGVGFDWLLFDMEHAPLTFETMHQMMQAMGGSETAPLVRVARNDSHLIGQALDGGAHGVMVPLVNTAEEARRAVAACKYPPEGVRGMGPRRASDYGRRFDDYMRRANREVIVIVQIETPEAVENIDAIVSVKGVDVAAIGPGDLSKTMGCFENRQSNKEYQQALDRVVRSCKRHGVVASMAYVTQPEQVRESIRRGFRFIGLGEDDVFLSEAATAALVASRGTRRR